MVMMGRMGKIFACVGLGGMLSFGAGCLSLQEEIELQERFVARGEYAQAYAVAAELAEDAGPDGADSNFWNADAGTLALMAGQPASAVAFLDRADNGFNDVARRSGGAEVADTALSIAVNDGMMPYAPEGVDRVFVNLYKAIAYGVQGDKDGFRVELNRARERQSEWFYACAKDVGEQQSALKGLSTDERALATEALKRVERPEVVALNPVVLAGLAEEGVATAELFSYLKGFGNAYAAHLAGVSRWCAGDASLNDLAMAMALAPRNTFVAQDHLLSKQGVAPERRVWVYVEDGLCPRREGNPLVIPYLGVGGRHGLRTITFDMPSLRERAEGAYRYSANGVTLELLTDVDALVHDQFDRLWAGILTRQIVRTASRVVAQEVALAAVERQTDDPLAAFLFSLLFVGYDLATNTADLRCADLLPKRVWMGAFERPASGVVTLQVGSEASYQVALQPQGNVAIWVRKPAAHAAPTILVVDLER